MNKQDLVAIVAEAGELSRPRAGAVVDAMLDAMTAALQRAEEVRLVGFGSFAVSHRKAAKGRNPRTGEEIEVPASTTVRFKPGKLLKDAIG